MNKKLWSKKPKNITSGIESLLSGEDILLDQKLFLLDIKASFAHTNELLAINILTKSEANKIKKQLRILEKKYINNTFKLNSDYEDSHSAIELFLTDELGAIGAKIHTGRSRNDQVLVALRLYAREALEQLRDINIDISESLLKQADHNKNLVLPGYTHMQKAMASSWGLWFSSFAESFLDNIDLINHTHSWININPLGSAAGYGVNLPIKRDISTSELGFRRKQLNSLYVQNSRGKFELQVIETLKQSMMDLRKFCWDMSLFLSQEFQYLTIDDVFTTGSSIMPNKRNPDVIEILRANYSIVSGHYYELENLLSLPSGYHRDLQLTKRSLILACECTLKSLKIVPELVKSINVNADISKASITNEMMMTDAVYELVKKGLPFREAYHQVKESEESINDPMASIKQRISVGGPGNLQLSILKRRLKKNIVNQNK
ncbi:MAG: argininosuccinate lyase [Gammaproteobacteria bacterium]|nr:argininosuccinate lyase [Gammaproteobacteria bacterium]MBT7752897.1 argininosuccinate lyase [Gammaproteobacteria bacterium]